MLEGGYNREKDYRYGKGWIPSLFIRKHQIRLVKINICFEDYILIGTWRFWNSGKGYSELI